MCWGCRFAYQCCLGWRWSVHNDCITNLFRWMPPKNHILLYTLRSNVSNFVCIAEVIINHANWNFARNCHLRWINWNTAKLGSLFIWVEPVSFSCVRAQHSVEWEIGISIFSRMELMQLNDERRRRYNAITVNAVDLQPFTASMFYVILAVELYILCVWSLSPCWGKWLQWTICWIDVNIKNDLLLFL